MRGRPGSLLVSNSSSLSSSSQLCYQSFLCTAEAGVQSTMYEHLRQSNKYNASKPWNNTRQKQGASTLGGQEARQLNSLIKALEVRTDLLTHKGWEWNGSQILKCQHSTLHNSNYKAGHQCLGVTRASDQTTQEKSLAKVGLASVCLSWLYL